MDRTQSSFSSPAGRGRGRPNRGRGQGGGSSAAFTAASWRSAGPAPAPKSDAAAPPPVVASPPPPPAQAPPSASATPSTDSQAPAPSKPRSRAPSMRRTSSQRPSRRPSVSDAPQPVDVPPVPSASVTTPGGTSPPNGSRASRRGQRSRSGSKAGAHVPPPLSTNAQLPTVPAIASAPANVSGFSSRPSIDTLVQQVRAIAIDHSNKNGDWAQDDDDTLPDLDDWNIGGDKRGIDILSPVRETSPTELPLPPIQRDMPVTAPPHISTHDIPTDPSLPHKKGRNSRGGKGKRKGHAAGADGVDGLPSGAGIEGVPSSSAAVPSNGGSESSQSKNAPPPRKRSHSSAKRDVPPKGNQVPRPQSAASKVSPVRGGATTVSVPSTSVMESKAEDSVVVQTSVPSAVTPSLSTVDSSSTPTPVTIIDVKVNGDTASHPNPHPDPQPAASHPNNPGKPKYNESSSRPRSPRSPRTPQSQFNRPLGGSTPSTPTRTRRDDFLSHARTHSHDPARMGRSSRENFSPTHTPSSSRPRINLDALSRLNRTLGSNSPPIRVAAAVANT